MPFEESEKKAKPSSREAVWIFAAIACGYFYCSMQRISTGVVLPHMAQAYDFSASLVGFLSSLFFYTYGFLQNVWGAVNDRAGPLRSCAVGLAIAGAGSLVMLVSHAPFFIGLSRILCGLGLAAIFSGIYLYAALEFPSEQYPFWVGCIQVVGNSGTVAAVGPLGWLMDRLGYNGLYLVLAVWAFALSGLLWALRGRSPRVRAAASSGSWGRRLCMIGEDVKIGFRLVAAHRPLAVIIFVWAALCAAVMTLQGLWGVPWMSASSGAAVTTARFWTTFVCVGLVVGSAVGARVAVLSRGGRAGILCIMLLLSTSWAFYMLGAWVGVGASAMGGLGFLVGLFSGAGTVFCSSSIKSLVPLSRVGLATGTGQFLLYGMLILEQWGSGLIIDRFPGDSPGSYLNAGYLAGFGAIVLIVWIATLSILSVPSFSGDDKRSS